jgi:predicted Rossmann fold flavoprotein
MEVFDVAIVGAGAAGLFCAGVAGQLGVRVLLLDHHPKVAEKIRISGGGRCNFTNLNTSPGQFLGANPHFCRSALARYTPRDFLDLLRRYDVPYHEKHKGQLFCDRSAQDLIDVLRSECAAGSVTHWQPCAVRQVSLARVDPGYVLQTERGTVRVARLVIATGGLSIPKIGATDFGLRIARQFDLPVVEPRPGLVPLTMAPAEWSRWSPLSGLSLPVRVTTGQGRHRIRFDEDLLITHRGLSGPAGLQISSYWRGGEPIELDLLPDFDLLVALRDLRMRSRKHLPTELATWLPGRLVDTWIAASEEGSTQWQRPLAEVKDKALVALADQLTRWSLVPSGTEGYAKAEVMTGGVDTRALSSQSLESRQPGLHFIGEVVDVTGWLGGYNFQWAWASAFACAQALAASLGQGSPKTL